MMPLCLSAVRLSGLSVGWSGCLHGSLRMRRAAFRVLVARAPGRRLARRWLARLGVLAWCAHLQSLVIEAERLDRRPEARRVGPADRDRLLPHRPRQRTREWMRQQSLNRIRIVGDQRPAQVLEVR